MAAHITPPPGSPHSPGPAAHLMHRPAELVSAPPDFKIYDSQLAFEFGIHRISESVPLDLTEINRMMNTPFELPRNPDFNFNTAGIRSRIAVEAHFPTITFTPEQVLTAISHQLRIQKKTIHPPFFCGGAVLNAVSQVPLKDLDPVTFLQDTDLHLPRNLFVSLIIDCLTKNGSILDFRDPKVRSWIKEVYLFNCKQVPDTYSFISFGPIDWKFITRSGCDSGHRFHLSIANRILLPVFGNQLYYYNRAKTNSPDGHHASLFDLRNKIFREDGPDKLTGLAARRVHAAINGFNIISQCSEKELDANFEHEYPTPEVFQAKLYNFFHYKYATDLHGGFLTFFQWLKFLNRLPEKAQREAYIISCAKAWTPRRGAIADPPINSKSDLEVLSDSCAEGQPHPVPYRHFATLANLIIKSPDSAISAIHLVHGVFLHEWLNENKSISFDPSSPTWKLCWGAGRFPYYIEMADFETTFVQAFKSWRELMPFHEEIKGLFFDLGFTKLAFSEEGLKIFVESFFTAYKARVELEMVMNKFSFSREMKQLKAILPQLIPYCSKVLIDEWGFLVRLRKVKTSAMLAPKIYELLSLIEASLLNIKGAQLTQTAAKFADVLKLPKSDLSGHKDLEKLLYDSLIALKNKALKASTDLQMLKLTQDLYLLSISEYFSARPSEAILEKFLSLYKTVISKGNFSDLMQLYIGFRKQFPKTLEHPPKPLCEQVEALSKSHPVLVATAKSVLSLIVQVFHRQIIEYKESDRKAPRREAIADPLLMKDNSINSKSYLGESDIKREKFHLYFLLESAIFLRDPASNGIINKCLTLILQSPVKTSSSDNAMLAAMFLQIMQNNSHLSVEPSLVDPLFASLIDSENHVASGIRLGMYNAPKHFPTEAVKIYLSILCACLKRPYDRLSQTTIAECFKFLCQEQMKGPLSDRQQKQLNEMASLNYLKLIEQYTLFLLSIQHDNAVRYLDTLKTSLGDAFVPIWMTFCKELLIQSHDAYLAQVAEEWLSLASTAPDFIELGCVLISKLAAQGLEKNLFAMISKLRDILDRETATPFLPALQGLINDFSLSGRKEQVKGLCKYLPVSIKKSPVAASTPVSLSSSPPPPPIPPPPPLPFAPIATSIETRQMALEERYCRLAEELTREDLTVDCGPVPDLPKPFVTSLIDVVILILSDHKLRIKYRVSITVALLKLLENHRSQVPLAELREIVDLLNSAEMFDLCIDLWKHLSHNHKKDSKVAMTIIKSACRLSNIDMVDSIWQFLSSSLAHRREIKKNADEIIFILTKTKQVKAMTSAIIIFMASDGGFVPKKSAIDILKVLTEGVIGHAADVGGMKLVMKGFRLALLSANLIPSSSMSEDPRILLEEVCSFSPVFFRKSKKGAKALKLGTTKVIVPKLIDKRGGQWKQQKVEPKTTNFHERFATGVGKGYVVATLRATERNFPKFSVMGCFGSIFFGVALLVAAAAMRTEPFRQGQKTWHAVTLMALTMAIGNIALRSFSLSSDVLNTTVDFGVLVAPYQGFTESNSLTDVVALIVYLFHAYA